MSNRHWKSIFCQPKFFKFQTDNSQIDALKPFPKFKTTLNPLKNTAITIKMFFLGPDQLFCGCFSNGFGQSLPSDGMSSSQKAIIERLTGIHRHDSFANSETLLILLGTQSQDQELWRPANMVRSVIEPSKSSLVFIKNSPTNFVSNRKISRASLKRFEKILQNVRFWKYFNWFFLL